MIKFKKFTVKEKSTSFTENNQVNNLILKSDYDILIIENKTIVIVF